MVPTVARHTIQLQQAEVSDQLQLQSIHGFFRFLNHMWLVLFYTSYFNRHITRKSPCTIFHIADHFFIWKPLHISGFCFVLSYVSLKHLLCILQQHLQILSEKSDVSYLTHCYLSCVISVLRNMLYSDSKQDR